MYVIQVIWLIPIYLQYKLYTESSGPKVWISIAIYLTDMIQQPSNPNQRTAATNHWKNLFVQCILPVCFNAVE